MTGLWWSCSQFTPARAESGLARSGCVPRPLQPEMAKFGLFACSVWNDFFILVLSESLARNCISCRPYARSCNDLTQRCKSVSWWGTGGFSDTLFFPPFLLLWGWQKNPFVIFGTLTLGEINSFFVVVIRGEWKTRRSSDAPRVNRLQKNPRRSPALCWAAARWYVNLIARIPLAGTTHIRWEPWRHGNNFACVCVSERVTSELREPGSILGH